MRFKRQKRHRRAVRFFTTCFGFREPFKVFCDGTFVHHLLSNQILPADDAIAKLLGGQVKLFTTGCVLLELKALGQSHSKALEAANNLSIARCNHEKRKHAVSCIMEVIGKSNAEHFFVATQDSDLKKQLQEIPGVPLIFGLRNALFMEQPTDLERQFVKSLEDKRSHITEVERSLLQKVTKKLIKDNMETDETDETNEDEDLGEQISEIQLEKEKKKKRNIDDLKDRPQFKRKKAKGPNPLSCLKKKKKVNPNQHPPEKKKDGDDATQKRTRKRKRTRKTKTPTETGTL